MNSALKCKQIASGLYGNKIPLDWHSLTEEEQLEFVSYNSPHALEERNPHETIILIEEQSKQIETLLNNVINATQNKLSEGKHLPSDRINLETLLNDGYLKE